VLFPRGIRIAGSTGILDMAGILGESFGRTGELVFLVGFWAAVATSTLGVWQGVPYLFAHIIGLMKGAPGADAEREVSTRSRLYRGYPLFMTFPPMLLFLAERLRDPRDQIRAADSTSLFTRPLAAGTSPRR
jgi:hypothetical protein